MDPGGEKVRSCSDIIPRRNQVESLSRSVGCLPSSDERISASVFELWLRSDRRLGVRFIMDDLIESDRQISCVQS
jgi:hypothetical protein